MVPFSWNLNFHHQMWIVFSTLVHSHCLRCDGRTSPMCSFILFYLIWFWFFFSFWFLFFFARFCSALLCSLHVSLALAHTLTNYFTQSAILTGTTNRLIHTTKSSEITLAITLEYLYIQHKNELCGCEWFPFCLKNLCIWSITRFWFSGWRHEYIYLKKFLIFMTRK